MALQSLQQNATRLGQRIQENFKESTRDFPILAGNPSAQTSASYFDSSDDKLREIDKLLESAAERDRLEGMKRLIAAISRGRDVGSFFARVVKQVASPSVEIRKLAYIYLLRYAAQNPDLLLLSINTFQKDLSDASPLIRSMSLRVLTSIRLPVIQGIVMIGLQKLVNDRNPWVRKTVAGGLVKMYDMDATTQSDLLPLLTKLLATASPITLGSALTAFEAMCPDDLASLHVHFRRLCRLLVDADEWGQLVALDVLMRYARAMLERPETSGSVEAKTDGEAELDPDIELLLHCALPLFQSRNYAVVISAVKLFYELAPSSCDHDGEDISQRAIIQPLLKLADGGNCARPEVSSIALEVCVAVARERPWLLRPHHARFLVRSRETVKVKRDKIRILRQLWTPELSESMMREFKAYIRSPEPVVVQDAIEAIGFLAAQQPDLRTQAFGILLKSLRSTRDACVGHAVIVIKSLLQSADDASHSTKLVNRLCQQLPAIRNSNARACIYWLVGQHAAVAESEKDSETHGYPGVALWAPDALRLGVKGFAKEDPVVKLQILTLAARLYVLCPHARAISLLTSHLFQLARYDKDWDVRDRGRFLKGLLRGIQPSAQMNDAGGEDDEDREAGGVILRREQVQVVLYGGRDANMKENLPSDTISSAHYDLATLSSIIGKRLGNYFPLPEWSEDPSDPSLREVEEEQAPVAPAITAISSSSVRPSPVPTPFPGTSSSSLPSRASPASGSATAGKGKFKDLETFLASSSSEEESDDDEEEEEGDDETDDDESDAETDSASEEGVTRG